MAYEVYFDNMLFPIAPEKIDMKVNGANKSIDLVNEGEVSIIKTPKLMTINFDVILPQFKYPFGNYSNGFKKANYYLEKLKLFKQSKESFSFKVIRTTYDGEMLFDTDILVTLEDYSIKEDVSQGIDVVVSINLKEFKGVSSKNLDVDKNLRETKNSPKPKVQNKTYTVVKGDTLWSISKRYYGDGNKYMTIANFNKISNPSFIKIGQVLTIPVVD